LEQHTRRQLIDFFHATAYLSEVAQAAFPRKTDKPKREVWLHERCKQLKHQAGVVDNLITEMEKFAKRTQLSKTVKEKLTAAQTYFANNHQRMNYPDHVAQDLPIGSGVTEAACKTLVK
jgi:ATP-dependent Lon protease